MAAAVVDSKSGGRLPHGRPAAALPRPGGGGLRVGGGVLRAGGSGLDGQRTSAECIFGALPRQRAADMRGAKRERAPGPIRPCLSRRMPYSGFVPAAALSGEMPACAHSAIRMCN